MPYLLDTDTASLAFNKNERVRTRIRQAPAPGVWLSAISAEEIMRGALSVISSNRDKIGMVAAHSFFTRSLSSLCEYRVHPYNAEAALIYASFPAQVKRLGTQDCRIAASAIAAGWVVVTANYRHFSQIPGVQIEDWTQTTF